MFFRTVYDSDGHKMFMEKLDESIQQHDKEIEKMCNFHYQGFIESVNELLNVKGDTHKLKVRYLVHDVKYVWRFCSYKDKDFAYMNLKCLGPVSVDYKCKIDLFCI